MLFRKDSIRKAVVAGRFYPADKSELISIIDRIYEKEKDNFVKLPPSQDIIGGIIPHAGYIYSLPQAIYFFALLKETQQKFDTVVILNPDHYGNGDLISIDGHNQWETPLGIVSVDVDLANELSFPKSKLAQSQEHSAEVIIPLLQYFLDYDFKILPISLKSQTHENSYKLAFEIEEYSKKLNRSILFIASSDFSHFESPDFGFEQDERVVKEILKLNSENVIRQVKKHNISMCGYGPVMSLIEYSKIINENPKAEILKRGHSGETYPSDEVVDYISFLFSHNKNG